MWSPDQIIYLEKMGRIKHGVKQCPYCKKFVSVHSLRCKCCGARLRGKRRGKQRGMYGGQLVSERDLKQMI